MLNTVFASGLNHARAIVSWFDLDPDLWEVAAYGDQLASRYDRVILVRPVEGPTQEHFLWLSTVLAPRVTSIDNITALHWTYEEFYRSVPEKALLSYQDPVLG
jgi:hypothetical protein